MKIALIGYGKMGHIIEETAREKGHEISHRIDIGNEKELKLIAPVNTDVAIEFTQPGSAFENIKSCILQDVPVLSGTTGWLAKKNEIDKLCIEKNGTFFYASNYSIGVNIFFRINEVLARIMNSFPSYDVGITEVHHTEKKDAPSGTAITLAEGIISNLERKDGWVRSETNVSSKIPVESIREGKIPGTHIIKYHSDADIIELKHEAFSRKGFALGAVMVAEWIKGKKGVLQMKDFLNI